MLAIENFGVTLRRLPTVRYEVFLKEIQHLTMLDLSMDESKLKTIAAGRIRASIRLTSLRQRQRSNTVSDLNHMNDATNYTHLLSAALSTTYSRCPFDIEFICGSCGFSISVAILAGPSIPIRCAWCFISLAKYREKKLRTLMAGRIYVVVRETLRTTLEERTRVLAR